MSAQRQYSFFDKVISCLQEGMETLFAPAVAQRDIPMNADLSAESSRDLSTACDSDKLLSENEKQLSARLMRINHAGEVCAQALYRGQALTARELAVSLAMTQAATEEADHLAWCETRVHELGSHTSYLNPVWYIHSFLIGAVAGAIGDKWSLGFIEATEQQVTAHLQTHLDLISPRDKKSLAILQQMQVDEQAHAVQAKQAGAAELPAMIKTVMACSAKVMTTVTYWI